MKRHRHTTPLRGVEVVPRPAPGNPDYRPVNYRYAGETGHIHEVVHVGGRELAKVGFADRKIVYYLLEDLERRDAAAPALRDDATAPEREGALPRIVGPEIADEPTADDVIDATSDGATPARDEPAS